MFEYKYFVLSVQGTGLCLGCADNWTQGSLAGTPLSVIFAIFKKQPNFLETKKDVGVCLSRAYPYHQALALPLHEDKQRRACPRRVISIHYGHSNPLYTYNASTAIPPIAGKDVYTLLYNIRKVGSQKYKINCVTSLLHYRCMKFQICEI